MNMNMETQFSFLKLRIGIYEKYKAISLKTKPNAKQKFYGQKFELMTCRDAFQDEIRYLRKRFRVPTEGFADFTSCYKWAAGTIEDPKEYAKQDPLRVYANLQKGKADTPFIDYESALNKALRALRIRERWRETVEYYLLFNKVDAHEILPKSVLLTFTADKITGENNLCLQISTDTKENDIREWWRTIQTYQGIMRSQKGLDLATMDDETWRKLDELDPAPSVSKQRAKKVRKHDVSVFKKYQLAYTLRHEGKSYNEIKKVLHCGQSEVGVYIKHFKDIIKAVELD